MKQTESVKNESFSPHADKISQLKRTGRNNDDFFITANVVPRQPERCINKLNHQSSIILKQTENDTKVLVLRKINEII